uniref:Uncharacterized protein n=1 Tax=Anguilla anguilla TaxID=7936 RepID=A0A0E9QJC3_ANGAN
MNFDQTNNRKLGYPTNRAVCKGHTETGHAVETLGERGSASSRP